MLIFASCWVGMSITDSFVSCYFVELHFSLLLLGTFITLPTCESSLSSGCLTLILVMTWIPTIICELSGHWIFCNNSSSTAFFNHKQPMILLALTCFADWLTHLLGLDSEWNFKNYITIKKKFNPFRLRGFFAKKNSVMLEEEILWITLYIDYDFLDCLYFMCISLKMSLITLSLILDEF